MKKAMTKRMLTIGQLARYAGVTIKAIRHYHKLGLLEEPPRDASNYRRYGARDAIALVKIRTLREAGVPLTRIGELLAADPERFSAAVREIEGRIRRRIEELGESADRIATLAGGVDRFVAPEVGDYLRRLRDLGVSEGTIRLERDVWILVESVSPAAASLLAADKRNAIDEPEFQAIYLEYDRAFDWPPDDRRLEVLAERSRRWMAGRKVGIEGRHGSILDPGLVEIVANSFSGASAAWARLAEIPASVDMGGRASPETIRHSAG